MLLDSQPANFEREAGMTLMENFLQMYDNIDAYVRQQGYDHGCN